ncbi:GL16072 [Drosophila persimilis]|uniref:GL16072 n=1 Tax=Drosophila persimilis TaxID=7234 RepID=B4H5M0_DROPE|nr:GL16072 [Drosophila persimilis]
MEANTDFSQFCAKLKNENYVKHVKALRDLCVTKSVMKPTTFFESLPKMMEEEAAKAPPNKELGTVADYAELFKSLDEYPSNLQKIPKKRETQRAASLEQPELAEGMKRLEEHRSAAEVYNEFKGFQRKLAKAYEEAAALQKGRGRVHKEACAAADLFPADRKANADRRPRHRQMHSQPMKSRS